MSQDDKMLKIVCYRR